MKSFTRLLTVAALATALAGASMAISGTAQAATTPAGLTVSPLVGSWQFGVDNPADPITLTPPVAACPAGSQFYFNALVPQGSEANVVSSGALLTPLVTLGSDLAIGAQTGALTGGDVQLMVKPSLPAGTADTGLSAADAAKPVGTTIADATYSLIGACADGNFALVSSYVTPIEITAATRAPQPADWPANQFYDNLQWSWDTRATTAATLYELPKTVKVGDRALSAVRVTTAGTTPTGTAKILDGTTVLATVTLTKGIGVALLPPFTTTGAHLLTAVYSGSATLKPATSPAVTVTVVK